MSIQSEIDRIENNVAATYSNLEEMGADMPETQNTNNLPETVLTVKAVRYDEQSMSEAQKTQARNNIGAASAEEVSAISQEIVDLKENGGGSSVQPDYAQTDSTQPDFIKNKIVGDVVEYGDTLTWDGKDPGLGFSEVFMGGAMPTMVFYRVSDNIVTEEDLINGISTTFYTSLDGTEEMHVDLTLEDLDIIDGCVADFVNGSVFFITKDNVTIEDLGVTFEKKGIYFMEQMGVQYSKSITIPGYTFANKTVKKLDKKYFDVTWDNVKDKPFGIDWDNPTVLIDNQTYSISGGMAMSQDVEFGAGLYKIIFDGVTYIRTAVENNGFLLGNVAFMGGSNDTGEPFLIGYSQGMFLVCATDGEHTLSLIRPVINKIDTMFYDTKTVFYYELGSDVYLYKDLNGTKATLEELTEAVQKGVVEVSYGGFLYSLCKFVSIERSYGIVVIGANLVDGALVDKVLYTAEYTP